MGIEFLARSLNIQQVGNNAFTCGYDGDFRLHRIGTRQLLYAVTSFISWTNQFFIAKNIMFEMIFELRVLAWNFEKIDSFAFETR